MPSSANMAEAGKMANRRARTRRFIKSPTGGESSPGYRAGSTSRNFLRQIVDSQSGGCLAFNRPRSRIGSLHAEPFAHQSLQTRLVQQIEGKFLVGKHRQ